MGLGIAAALLAAGIASIASQGAAPSALPALVFTQVPLAAEPPGSETGGTVPVDYFAGSRIVLLEPGGRLRILTRKFHSARDPEISFDGTRLLFSARRGARDSWDIYEMNLDGSGIRQVTRDVGNAVGPVYQGRLFTLDSPQPWNQITFVSDHAGEMNEAEASPSTSLYTCRPDGSGVERITFNPSSDLDPAVLPDGRLLFPSWQGREFARGPSGRVALFAAMVDGIDYALFSGDEGKRVKLMPAVTPGRLVVFVEGDSVPWDGSGTLASVRLSRNLHSYEQLTEPADGLFHSPSPLGEEAILVSRRPSDGSGSHGIYSYGLNGGRIRPLFDDPDYHDIQAKVAGPRPRPDGRSTVLTQEVPTGLLYGLNVYDSDLPRDQWIRPGGALLLRVLEGLPRKADTRPGSFVPGAVSLPRRVLGEVAVDPDGSFNVRVPANIPLELQLVDESGLALRSCGWVWVRNRETRGCIGCHEDGERTPENHFVSALKRPSTVLTPPPRERRLVDLRRDVIPIIRSRCYGESCHGPEKIRPEFLRPGRSPEQIHAGLLAAHESEGSRSDGPYIHPGSARTSPLIWHLFGRNTSRPWDRPSESMVTRMMSAAGPLPLTWEERRTFAEWIDTGAHGAGLTAGSGSKEESDTE